ncbi:MAG: 3-carboxy-cis,cis-muconate cycloisomerase [Tabrizicola sp.]|nr:3-carboxy-cis,cis-muconate cycloisomerase [Tabrizicola sp.]
MPASPADSAVYRDLFGDAETAAFFTDSAEVRAMLLVEGVLARVQGALGVIPADAAAFIDRASREVRIDPAALAAETARNGVPVPGLLAAFRKSTEAPEPMRWLHWGATSQDIVDTALALRLRRVLELWDARLTELIAALGHLAETHAELPMAGRTYGQAATPTTFGAQVASWGRPLIRHRDRLVALREYVLQVSLSGGAGTLSAMGPQGPQVRAALAEALGLADPGASWHSERDGIAALGAWMAGLCATLGKMGEDLILLTATGLNEVRIAGAGGSSTMPQKQNPIGPSVLVALTRQVIGLSATLTGAGLHRQARDGAAWFTEWLTLPRMCVSTGRALALAAEVAGRIQPDAAAMERVLRTDAGTIHAEALTFALTDRMPRPEAVVAVTRLCAEGLATGTDLLTLAARDWPGLAVPLALGEARAEARAFAAAARAVKAQATGPAASEPVPDGP